MGIWVTSYNSFCLQGLLGSSLVCTTIHLMMERHSAHCITAWWVRSHPVHDSGAVWEVTWWPVVKYSISQKRFLLVSQKVNSYLEGVAGIFCWVFFFRNLRTYAMMLLIGACHRLQTASLFASDSSSPVGSAGSYNPRGQSSLPGSLNLWQNILLSWTPFKHLTAFWITQ